jgi:hypothetical protein
LVYRMPETEGSTHYREAGAGPGVKMEKRKITFQKKSKIFLKPIDIYDGIYYNKIKETPIT